MFEGLHDPHLCVHCRSGRLIRSSEMRRGLIVELDMIMLRLLTKMLLHQIRLTRRRVLWWHHTTELGGEIISKLAFLFLMFCFQTANQLVFSLPLLCLFPSSSSETILFPGGRIDVTFPTWSLEVISGATEDAICPPSVGTVGKGGGCIVGLTGGR